MSSNEILALAIVGGVIVLAIVIWFTLRRRHTAQLRDRFGEEEYERVVDASGNRNRAEAELDERKERVSKYELQPLTVADRDHYMGEWKEVKALFVDGPQEAILRADRLLTDVMKKRGYPVADYDQALADLTVDHGDWADHYRAGHQVAENQRMGEASTEDLRQGLVHYQSLFEAMVNDAVETDGDTEVRQRNAETV